MTKARCMLLMVLLCGVARTTYGQNGSTVQNSNDPSHASQRASVERACELVRQADAVAEQDRTEAFRLRREALDLFLALRASGVRTAALEYNIATLHARVDEPGRAIAAALRAKRRAPRDERVANTLAFARRLRDGGAGGGSSTSLMVMRSMDSALQRHAVWLCVAAWNLAWLPIIFAVSRGRMSGITLIAIVSAIVIGIGTGLLSTGSGIHSDDRIAVIVSSDAVPRKGCGSDYDPATRLPPANGTEVRWIEARRDGLGARWYRVEMPDGASAWIPAEAIEVVG